MRSIVSIPSLRGGLVLAALLAASCSSDSQVLVEPCPGGYTNCGTVCADLLADAKHCGACGAACPAGVACSNGVCAIDLCPAPRLVCGDRCVDPASDPLNCGACGVFCPSGQACVFGACSCPVGYSACNGQCIELASNPYNCGACGLACALGQSCVAGQCQCQVGLTNCGGVCVNLAGDGAHCGACDNACAPGLLCAAGACAATCPTGMDPCAETGSCVVLATDPRNCGVCGHACGVGEVCVDGRCGCPAGTADCTGTGRCDDIATDLANCGACGQSCAIGQACVDGVCGCSVAGQQVCDGVCVDPSQDPFNCGVCGHACTGGSSCSAGQCVGGGVGGSGGTTGGAGGTTGGTGGTTGGTGGTTGGTGGTTGGTGGTTGGAGGTTGGAGGTGGTTGGTGGTGVLTGYHRHDPWQGFAWTAVDSGERATITPEAFDDLTTDGPYCVQGNVPVTADYSAIAMVGFNVNQASTASAPLETWTPASLTEGGLLVNVTNRSGSTSVIRVQIQGPDGDESADDRWCAPLSQFNRDVIIPWDSFNTACWNNSGDYYAGQAIEAALVFVPGMGTDDTNPQDRAFDFCVNAIGPDDSSTGTGGTGGGTGACSNTVTGAGTITERYGLGYLKDGTRNAYVVQNNGWGSGFSSQTLTYSGASFTIGSATGSPGGDNAPFSYPSIFIGSNGSASSTGSDLPKQLSAISSLPTCLAWSGGSGEFNVAYDVWFNQTNTSSNPPTGAYLMVWYHDPAGYQPKGSSVATVSLAGRTWAVWHGMNGAVPVVSYVPTGDLASFSFDLMEFIDDSVERGYLQNSWYLTAVMGGFEIWTSGEGYRLDGFSAVVN